MIVAVMAFAVSACTAEEIINALIGYSNMYISPYVMDGASQKGESVDECSNNGFSKGDSLALVIFSEGYSPNSYEEGFIQTAIFDGNIWNADCASAFQPNKVEWKEIDNLKWKAMGENFEIYAYTPDVRQVLAWPSYNGCVSLNQDSIEEFRHSDFVFGRVITKKTNSYVSIPMEHKLAMLSVELLHSKEASVRVDSMSVTAYPDFWAHFALDKVYCINKERKSVKTHRRNDSIFSVILPAQNIADGQITLSMSDGRQKVLPVVMDMEFGMKHKVKAVCSKNGRIDVVGVEKMPWEMIEGDENDDEPKSYATGDVIVYHKSSNMNPVTMVVTGDGYTENDLQYGGKFEKQARSALDFLFGVEPYKSYMEYFNVYIIPALSADSGADNYTIGLDRNTYFNSGWSDNGKDMYANDILLMNFVQTFCPDLRDGKLTLDNLPICLLVNDVRHGGICYSWKSGKSFAIIPTTEGEWKLPGNEETGISVCNWRNTFLHEFGGHCFGRLMDEYYQEESGETYDLGPIEGHSWEMPFGLNITADETGVEDLVYWKEMIGDERFPKVGMYEGGYNYEKGIWRSEVVSAMDDNCRYFNAISRRIIVERIMKTAKQKFDFEDFCKKDVDYDELRDANSAPSRNNSRLKEFPRTPAPVFME